MDRFLFPDRGALTPGLVDLFLEFPVGATGAVPSTFTSNDGFGVVTRDSLGNYTANLQDTYVGLRKFHCKVRQATYSAAAATEGECTVNSVSSGTAPLVSFAMVNKAGTVTEVTNGDVIVLHLVLQSSTAGS